MLPTTGKPRACEEGRGAPSFHDLGTGIQHLDTVCAACWVFYVSVCLKQPHFQQLHEVRAALAAAESEKQTMQAVRQPLE